MEIVLVSAIDKPLNPENVGAHELKLGFEPLEHINQRF